MTVNTAFALTQDARWHLSQLAGGGSKWTLTDVIDSDNYGTVRVNVGICIIKTPGSLYRVWADDAGVCADVSSIQVAYGVVCGALGTDRNVPDPADKARRV